MSEIGVGMHTLLPGHKTWNLLDISHTFFRNNRIFNRPLFLFYYSSPLLAKFFPYPLWRLHIFSSVSFSLTRGRVWPGLLVIFTLVFQGYNPIHCWFTAFHFDRQLFF